MGIAVYVSSCLVLLNWVSTLHIFFKGKEILAVDSVAVLDNPLFGGFIFKSW